MPIDALRAASPSPFAYAFAAPPGDARPVVVHSDYAIEPYAPLFLRGWPFHRLSQSAPADIFLHHPAQRPSAFIAGRRHDGFDALSELDGVNRLADLLSHVAASRQPDVVELHASAALIGDRLALFVGPSLSGKSTLALQLLTRGHRLFADDRLLVGPLADNGAPPSFGMALGLTPRVRCPPHPAAGALFAQFVERHVARRAGNIGFLPLPDESAAAFGESAMLGAVILPERQESGGVSLQRASDAAACRVVLEQVHAPQLPATQLLAAVRALVGGVPAWHLRYDDSARAAGDVAAMMAG